MLKFRESWSVAKNSGDGKAGRTALSRGMVISLNLVLLVVLYYCSTAYTQEATLWLYLLAQMVLYGSHVFYLRCCEKWDIFDGLNILNLGLMLHLSFIPLLLYYELLPTIYHKLWDSEDFARAVVLVQALCVMVQIGYYIDPGRAVKVSALQGNISVRKLVLFLLILLALTSLTSALPLEIARSGLFIGLITLVFYLPYFLIVLVWGRGSFSTHAILSVGLLYSLGMSLFGGIGSKAGAANLLLACAMYRHYIVKPVKVWQAAVGMFAGIVIVVFMNYARAAGYMAGLTAESMNVFREGNWDMLLKAGLSSTLTPFEAFMVVLSTFPTEIPFQEGKRFLEENLYPLLPRLFFPDKPEIYGAGFFWDFHLSYLSLGDGRKTYEAISLPGHLYVDFGLLGVVAAGLLMGLVQRYVYKRLILCGITRGSLCLYGILSTYSIIAARGFYWSSYMVITGVLLPIAVIRLLRTTGSGVLVKDFVPLPQLPRANLV